MKYLSPGVRFMLLATFFFSSMNALVKLVPHLPAIEVVFFRSLISLVMSYLSLRSQHVSIWGKNKGLLMARGASGALALMLYFTLLQQIPLATAVTMQFLAPVFTSILGIMLVKEKVRPLQWVFFLVSFGGVLVVNGFDIRIDFIHVLMGIMAASGAGLAYTIIRKINTREHPLVIVFYFPLVTLPITGGYCLFNWVQPEGWDWMILLGIGVLTQIAQYFMTKAYQIEEISRIANLKYMGLIYALVFGYVFFDETFNFMAYLGMMLVMVGVILNVWYKQKKLEEEREVADKEVV